MNGNDPGPESTRPGRLPRGERKALLLDAAREAFAAAGYHAAGMDSIADLAGVSKPVLYQHFPGKLELYLAVLDQISESLIASVRAALDSTHDNRIRVEATIAAYFAFVADKSGGFRLIFESDLTNVPEAAEKVAQTNAVCAELVAGVIQEDTSLPPAQAEMLGTGLTGMAQTAARHWLESPEEVSAREAAQAISALAWRGISGFPLINPSNAETEKESSWR
ncbi:MAG: TetR/AcrR family transcriptional regulator [Candidatus Nanopelagicales bacterium]